MSDDARLSDASGAPHTRQNAGWCAWWRGLGPAARWLPLVCTAAVLATHAALDGLKLLHLVLAAATLLLAYAGPRARPLARLLLPLLLLLVAYDLHRYLLPALRGPVRVAEPLAWELSWFGIEDGGRLVTPAAWWQSRTHPALDLVCGLAYLAFVPAYVAAAAWWRFRRAATPAEKRTAERAMWALLLLQGAGIVTYFVYPAAPPWYAALHGTGPALLTAPSDPAGAARFDALVGAPIFASYYGQSANVFGAMPSLHCATPLLALLYAWRLRSLRGACAALFATVCFAAVYLNHHYIVDALVGAAFAALAFAAVEWLSRRA